jgi:hypothetical protein
VLIFRDGRIHKDDPVLDRPKADEIFKGLPTFDTLTTKSMSVLAIYRQPAIENFAKRRFVRNQPSCAVLWNRIIFAAGIPR